MLADLTIKEFLDKTASVSPVPGGGSVAALSGALAAALSVMVARLSIGKKAFTAVENEMREIIKKADILKKRLTAAIDKDSNAYNTVMEAFKLPQTNEEEKKKRTLAIQTSLKEASLVPLETAKDAFAVMDLAWEVIKNGNPNAVTDGAVGAMMARTAVLAALYNVKINLASIKDSQFVEETGKQIRRLKKAALDKEKSILEDVNMKL